MKGPFVFRQDESMHWYRIPKDEAEKFDRLQKQIREAGPRSSEGIELINEFESSFRKYRTGSPSHTPFYIKEEQ